MIFANLAAAVFGASLQVGDRAPDFSVVDTDGHTHTLVEMTKHGPVVLAFFPKAFTPGCTNEMKGYRDRFAELSAACSEVLGISTDTLATQKKFKAELHVPFALVADPEGRLVELYGVKTPVVTFAMRRSFVVGTDGRINAIFEGSDAIDPSGAISACATKH